MEFKNWLKLNEKGLVQAADVPYDIRQRYGPTGRYGDPESAGSRFAGTVLGGIGNAYRNKRYAIDRGGKMPNPAIATPQVGIETQEGIVIDVEVGLPILDTEAFMCGSKDFKIVRDYADQLVAAECQCKLRAEHIMKEHPKSNKVKLENPEIIKKTKTTMEQGYEDESGTWWNKGDEGLRCSIMFVWGDPDEHGINTNWESRMSQQDYGSVPQHNSGDWRGAKDVADRSFYKHHHATHKGYNY